VGTMPELKQEAAEAQSLPTCDLDHSEPGSLRLECPVTCLDVVLSASAFRPLHRARHDWKNPVRTVSDVVTLHQQDKLSELRGLGERRIGEIAHWLNYTGLLKRAASLSAEASESATAHADPDYAVLTQGDGTDERDGGSCRT
jgi:hypothetical protein